MIYGIILKDLRNAEYLQFMKDVLALTTANNPVSLNIQTQYTLLQTQVTDLETLFKLSQSSKFTEELQNLDIRRDRAISGIRQIVAGYCNHYDVGTANAGRLLSDNLKLYGENIERQNYQAETATLNGIASDWENKQPLTEAMTLLNLTEWKNEMKTANVLFNEKYIERTQEYGAANEETISSEKAETNNLYYKLRDNIVARATIDSTPGYTKIIKELNALVDQYCTLLRNREPKKENENPPL